jgi:hypothetical protein
MPGTLLSVYPAATTRKYKDERRKHTSRSQRRSSGEETLVRWRVLFGRVNC